MSRIDAHRRSLLLLSLLFTLGAVGLDHQRRTADAAEARAASAPRAATNARAVPKAQAPAQGRPLRVLFVGNGLTSANDLPLMVAQLARAAGEPRPFFFETELKSAASLQTHLEEVRVLKRLDEGPWDAVVLQEQSQRLGFLPRLREKRSNSYARQLHEEIGKVGARTVFFETFARREGDFTNFAFDAYRVMQQRVSEGYRLIAIELEAELVQVGTLWQWVIETRPALRLWNEDGILPSTAGSYLAACAFYAHFYGKSPVGNPYLAGLDPTDASHLQLAASSLVEGDRVLIEGRAHALAQRHAEGEPARREAERAEQAQLDSAALQARRIHERIAADRREQAVYLARFRVPIRGYSADRCRACKRAIRYMQRAGLSYEELHVDDDPSAAAAMAKLNPRGSVPTIEVGSRTMIGWDPRRFETLLDKAVPEHL